MKNRIFNISFGFILIAYSVSTFSTQSEAEKNNESKICKSFIDSLSDSKDRCGELNLNNEFITYKWSQIKNKDLTSLSKNSIFIEDEKQNQHLQNEFEKKNKELEVSYFDYNNDSKIDTVFRSKRPSAIGTCLEDQPHSEFIYYAINKDEKFGITPVKLRYSTTLNPIAFEGKNYTYAVLSKNDVYIINVYEVKKGRSTNGLFSASYLPRCMFEIN